MTDISPEQYSMICDLFERFHQGYFNTEAHPDDWFPMTSPQARSFTNRVIEIFEMERGDANV